nr:hypothetical protein [Tanacetum cinerariifolium]
IEYEKGLPKKTETPQVMMIKGDKIQKSNKKSLKAKGNGKANGKGKDKQVYIPKPKNPKPAAKSTQLRMTPATALTPLYTPQQNGVSERRNRTLLDMVRSMMNLTTLSLSFWDYALESATRILNMVPTKKVDKTPYELCGRALDLEEIHDEDTSPFEITSEISIEVEGFEPPQEEVISIRRSERTHQAPNRLCLNVEVEEHSLGDLNELASYKAAMLDSESNKWIDAIAIRILIYIATFYDYEIWQMDVNTAFLNGYLDEDIYMVQPEGFVDLNHPRKMDKILKRYIMDNSKRGHIPIQERLDLNKTQSASTPKEVKQMQMYHMLQLWLPLSELRVDCYCDAGFKIDRDDTKSQTGYVFILNGGAVDWKSSKQSTTAMSATEAEYIVAMEAVWIRKSISGLGIVPTINEPIRMFYNNSAALHFANEPGV